MSESMLRTALQYIDDHTEEMLDLWARLVEIESPSNNMDGCRRAAELLFDYCRSIHLNTKLVSFENAGAALVASTADSTENGIGFMGHYDTVHPVGSFGPEVLCKEGDIWRGPGVCDCKGGLIMGLLVIQALQAAGYTERPLKVIYLGDEECSHAQTNGRAEQLIMDESRGLAAMFNLESGDDGLITTGRKGGIDLDFHIHGIAAHAGQCPEKGASAILEAAHKIQAIEALTDYNDVTYVCGFIQGGSARNVVSEHCWFMVDVRYREETGRQKAMAALEKIAAAAYIKGTETKLVHRGSFAAMEETEGNKDLFRRWADASESLGYGRPEPYYTGGNSDAAYSTLAGVPTICSAGVTGDFVHTTSEYARVSSLTERAKVLVKTILDM